MIDALSSRPDPFVFFLVLFPVSLLVLVGAYVLTVKYSKFEGEQSEAAFGLGIGAIFGIIALILGFSFAFAADRFEARRALIVDEAIAVGRTNVQAGFLPVAQQAPFRHTLVDYAQALLDSYANLQNEQGEVQAGLRAMALHEQLWGMVAADASKDTRNLLYGSLINSIDEAGDIAKRQTAALNNHVPTAIVVIILFATIVGSVLLGLTFGRAKARHPVLAVAFCLLCAATVYTIVDLDDGRRGFIRLETGPLQATLDENHR